MPTTTLYLFAPVEPITNVKERLKNKVNDIISFHISIYTVEELITSFKEENIKSEYFLTITKIHLKH